MLVMVCVELARLINEKWLETCLNVLLKACVVLAWKISEMQLELFECMKGKLK